MTVNYHRLLNYYLCFFFDKRSLEGGIWAAWPDNIWTTEISMCT